MQIKRYFTNGYEGNVRDMFKWKNVDVIIKNDQTNEIIFDGRGLQFPEKYSQNACDIIAKMYFRKSGVPVTGHEVSMSQVAHRMVNFWVCAMVDEGLISGTIDTPDMKYPESAIVYDELTYMLLNQMWAPNSPQWFNTGLFHEYGIEGTPNGFYYNTKLGKVVEAKDGYSRTPGSACFITAINDSLLGNQSIMDSLTTHTRLFKYGSGIGSNYSSLRAKGEKLSVGGKSSGLMSFLKVFDRNAGAIKSGGANRRAAVLATLNLDHPEILDYVRWKAREEDKVVALGKMGYDTSISGEAYETVSGQNMNLSIQIPNIFMEQLNNNRMWELKGRVDSSINTEIKVDELWDEIAWAAWRAGDPGVQFVDMINEWNTCPEAGPIKSSNPCLTGDMRILTEDGYIPLSELEGKEVNLINGFGVVSKGKVWCSGVKDTIVLNLSNEKKIKCTPNHVFMTSDGDSVQAKDLKDKFLQEWKTEIVGRHGLHVTSIQDGKKEKVYDFEEPKTHWGVVEGIITHNCGEFLFIDNSSCNLASINVLKFYEKDKGFGTVRLNKENRNMLFYTSDIEGLETSSPPLNKLEDFSKVLGEITNKLTGRFDLIGFIHAIELIQLVLESTNYMGCFPTPEIAENTYLYRPTGLGLANLGTLLMNLGLPYDSDEARNVSAALCSAITAASYRMSAEMAKKVGAFPKYEENKFMLEIMKKHKRRLLAKVSGTDVDRRIPIINRDPGSNKIKSIESAFNTIYSIWDDVINIGMEHGFRNAAVSLLAPTGTIAFAMDCDTTSLEPFYSHLVHKKLVDGSWMQIVNTNIRNCLDLLGGYIESDIVAIEQYVKDNNGKIEGAPFLKEEHLPIFDTAAKCGDGERCISPNGHVKMVAAVQPHLSMGVSKCISGDSLVVSNDGLIRIRDLYSNESEDTFSRRILTISSLDGPRQTDAFYYGGVRPIRKVKLQSGHRICGTYPHKLLVASDHGLVWKSLGEIKSGDNVAIQYGADIWSEKIPSLEHIHTSTIYGSQKRVRLPGEMSSDFAFFLGAYASEGHITEATWTISITNPYLNILEKLQRICQNIFGIESKIDDCNGSKCPSLYITSKTIVEFMGALGCGSRASNKRIPDIVLRSPRSMILSFLQGLSLDAYIPTPKTSGKLGGSWAICLDSQNLLDDLQIVMTNLGVVHNRHSKYNKKYKKYYGVISAPGPQGQFMCRLVPFVENHKIETMNKYLNLSYKENHNDMIPGITREELYSLIPSSDRSSKNKFHHLLNPRHSNVTRYVVQQISNIPGVTLPSWLHQVIDENIHFSPVAYVIDGQEDKVYDLSVPVTHSFVANGIMNHNTVNLPESATPEDIKGVFNAAWSLGCKSITVYRDNSKTVQPLTTTREKERTLDDVDKMTYWELLEFIKNKIQTEATKVYGEVAPKEIQVVPEKPKLRIEREKLPNEPKCIKNVVSMANQNFHIIRSFYDDGRLGEIFVTAAKQGNTAKGFLEIMSILISKALQYGMPSAVISKMLRNHEFSPNGLVHGHPNIKNAMSIPDLISKFIDITYGDYRFCQVKPEHNDPTSRDPNLNISPQEEIIGDSCAECGSNKMIKAGTCKYCIACGTSTGCS